MTRRILRLIEQRKVRPEQVLAVTFTRTAANDLRKALEKTLGEGFRNFRATTLHSLCFNVVKESSFLTIRGRSPRFLLTSTKAGCLGFEAAPMLADLKAENEKYGGAREQSKRIRQFEAMWAKRQQDPLGATGNSVEAAYGTSLLNWLKFHGGMMVGELVKETYEFMAAEPDTLWRSRFKAILVDEYQDLNKVDQAVIDLLCGEGTLCSVVGDLDQSIYSFRCAHPEGLQEYAVKDGVESLTMEKSRRCPTTHLTAAQALIFQNTKKASKYPTPLPDAKAGAVYVRRWPDRETEVRGIVEFVKDCEGRGLGLGEILVMVPSRVIGKDIKTALRHEGIEAHSYFAEEQLEEEATQRAFTLLTLLAKPTDAVALRCWLGGWKDGHRAGSYKKLREHCEKNNAGVRDVLDQLVSKALSLPGTAPLVKSYEELLAELKKLEGLAGSKLLDALFPEEAEWAEDIRALVADSVGDEDAASSLHEDLVELITQPVMPTEVDYVRIMSLHKSKGLTASASVIAGAIDGLIPRPYDPKKSFLTRDEHSEEQRRLFYVAMTRSTDYLLISSAVLVANQFEFGPEIPGIKTQGGFRTITSSFVTGLGTKLPAASTLMAFS
jgi:superfamily I DNA/RNA helicase